ncbi:MAG: MBL fold metallo-hydrolase [Acidimicrobiales bacterium]
MEARVWGCRGSVAAPGPTTVRYGGNTSCIEVRLDDGAVLILDAGTGIRELGLQLTDEGVKTIHLFLSHLHLDHLQGLAFFTPLYDESVFLHIWGPRSPVKSLRERIGTYMSEPLFPVNLSDVPCHTVFHDAPEDGCDFGAATVWADQVSHQGPTVGYRVEADWTLAYIPDHEPALGLDLATVEPAWLSGYPLAANADVLVHDAQYTEAEYPNHIGWGHSSVDQVVHFARRSGVARLVLFHHDPRHTDGVLDVFLQRACELWGTEGLPPVLAHEGMSLRELASAALHITLG